LLAVLILCQVVSVTIDKILSPLRAKNCKKSMEKRASSLIGGMDVSASYLRSPSRERVAR